MHILLYLILGHIAALAKMQPIATDRVVWSVCLCVCVSWLWTLHKWLKCSRCHLGGDSYEPKEQCIKKV